LVTHSLIIPLTYSAIADLHTFQITVAHALGFPVSTNRLLATDLSTQTTTVSHFKCHTWSLQFTRSALLQIRTFHGFLPFGLTDNCPRTSFSLSYKPLISHAGNAPIVALLLKRVTSLLTRSHDPSPLLRHPSVYSSCLATNEGKRCATRHGSARLGSARRKHRFVYCCVIVGACFDVTVLTWRKCSAI
jgi:hypothetical protein